MKILLLSTDTDHHRYTINFLKKKKIDFEKYFFETSSVQAGFNTKAYYSKKEKEFEKKIFFKKINYYLDTQKIIKIKNINNNLALKKIKLIKPDLGVVFGTRKISLKIINQFKYGLINVHRGIATKYRGLDSELWAVYHRDYKNIGITIHKIDKNFDTGKIITQKRIQIKKKDEIYMLRYVTTLLATNELTKILKYFIKYKKFSFKNIKPLGRYYSFMPSVLKEKLILHAEKR